jgi:hypothetical protein
VLVFDGGELVGVVTASDLTREPATPTPAGP